MAPYIGYDNAAKIAKKALKNGTTLKDEAIKSGLISEKDYLKIVDPKKMINPIFKKISHLLINFLIVENF